MNKLEEFLSIPDKHQRHNALERYAKSLGVHSEEAKLPGGIYHEEKLVLLIHDAQKRRQKTRNINLKLGFGAALAGFAILLLILLVPKLFEDFYGRQSAVEESKKNVLQARDKNGKVLTDDQGQPVLYELMDGEYEEFDNQGLLRFKCYYKQGELLKKVEYNNKGAVIREYNFEVDTGK